MRVPSISIITATLNCATTLPHLVSSLMAQDDQTFKWVVVDGGSVDGTTMILEQFPTERIHVIHGHDFGIYDALNKGVSAADGDYYLVLGADDLLAPCAVREFRAAAADGMYDFVAARVSTSAGMLMPMRGARWLRGGNAFVASHAVGTLIRRKLHERCGMYSSRYVNAADMYFVLSAITKHSATIRPGEFVAGTYGIDGVSTVDAICSLSDAFRIQVALGENRIVQLMLYCARLIRAVLFRGA